MEKQIIKAGWLEKRSQYLKKWRRRWLVLTSSSLSTYKTDSDTAKSTMELSLNLILDASPHLSDNTGEFIFTITLENERYFLRTTQDSDMCAWLNLINHTRQGNRVSSFSSPNYYHESKVLSDESLITSFTKMKELLYVREEELMQNLEEIYKVYVEKATQEHREISQAYEQESEKYRKVSQVLDTSNDVISKVREVQNASKAHMSMKDFETFNVSKLVVSTQEENLDKLIKSSIKVCLGNPAEVMVRRTHITRALKWRYTGERIDAITFSVNKDLRLTGVGVCTPYKMGRITYIKDFQVLRGGSTSSASIYKHSQRVAMQNCLETSIFKVQMESQVHIKKDNKYTVFFMNEGAHTYKCVDCNATIEGPERTVWTFVNTVFSQSHQSNRCDTVCGPIADFYFMVV